MTDRRTRFPWVKMGGPWLAEQMSNGLLPLWIRVALASWYRLDGKGVATFGAFGLDGLTAANWTAGEGPLQVDPDTGELLAPAKLTRALRTAELHGWIGKGSTVDRVTVPWSVVTVSGQGAPWRQLRRGFLEAQAAKPAAPGWIRVALASWGHLSPRGFAPFTSGELASLTGVANVRDALSIAATSGWLGGDGTPSRVTALPGSAWVGTTAA